MPTIGWIDALRTYNAGMPSWCVPRKGTPGYERVMRIRQGEQTKGFKEVLEDLERKTSGKPKKEKKSLAIDLAEPSKQVQEVKVPTIAEGVGSVKTDRSTKKMSSSNNKKAMAVVPVKYDAEEKPKEESKPESKKVAKSEDSDELKKLKARRKELQAKHNATDETTDPKAFYKTRGDLAQIDMKIRWAEKKNAGVWSGSIQNLYVNYTTGTALPSLWDLTGDTFVKVGHWSIDDQTGEYGFNTGIILKRPRVEGRDAFVNPSSDTETQVYPLSQAADAYKAVAKSVLEKDGYDVSSLPDEATTDLHDVKTPPKARTKKEKPVDPLASFKDAVKAAEKAYDDALTKYSGDTSGDSIKIRFDLEKARDRARARLTKERAKLRKAAKEETKEDSELPPLLSGKKDGEENSKHLAVLQEAAKEGRLYQLHGITRRGTVETPVFLRQGNDYHKIAVIALGRTTFPEEPHSVYFQPITRRIVLTEKEAKAKGMAKFHSKI
jgi:hypothetical protein